MGHTIAVKNLVEDLKMGDAADERPKVMYVGPYDLTYESETKTMYNVFRDLYFAIESAAERVYWLTGEISRSHVDELHSMYPKLSLVRVAAPLHRLAGRFFHILAGVRLVRREGISIVTNIAGSISFGFDAAVIGKMTGARVVVRVSGNEVASRRFSGAHRGVSGIIRHAADVVGQRFAVALADAVVVMSPLEQQRIQTLTRTPGKVFCCPRGIEMRKPSSTMRRHENQAHQVVLFVGRNSLEKGPDIVMGAAERLRPRSDIHFRIVGAYFAGDRRKEGNLEFLGYVDPREMNVVYDNADLLVMPSRTEGLPQVLLEALAAGLPVIGSPAVRDALPSSEHGVVASDATPDALAEKVICLLGNPAVLQQRSQLGRAFVEKHYDRDVMSRRYRAVLLGMDDK